MWDHGDPARYSKIGQKPQIRLYTVSPKERDCRSHVPWDPAHPQYKQCPRNLEFVQYGCGHQSYRTSLREGLSAAIIRERVKRGQSWGKKLDGLCPKCWSTWSTIKLPRFQAPRQSITRPLRPMERLQSKKFIPKKLI